MKQRQTNTTSREGRVSKLLFVLFLLLVAAAITISVQEIHKRHMKDKSTRRALAPEKLKHRFLSHNTCWRTVLQPRDSRADKTQLRFLIAYAALNTPKNIKRTAKHISAHRPDLVHLFGATDCPSLYSLASKTALPLQPYMNRAFGSSKNTAVAILSQVDPLADFQQLTTTHHIPHYAAHMHLNNTLVLVAGFDLSSTSSKAAAGASLDSLLKSLKEHRRTGEELLLIGRYAKTIGLTALQKMDADDIVLINTHYTSHAIRVVAATKALASKTASLSRHKDFFSIDLQ